MSLFAWPLPSRRSTSYWRGVSIAMTLGSTVDPSVMAMLTPRQYDVLRLLGKGQANKEIARALDISEGTVKIHLAAIFRVLEVRNRTEAVLKASALDI